MWDVQDGVKVHVLNSPRDVYGGSDGDVRSSGPLCEAEGAGV
jgi:hypothetical protein